MNNNNLKKVISELDKRTEFFKDAFEEYNIPPKIKNASESICIKFNIYGICDPMYIVNSIAYELGIGDGCGNFNDNEPDLSKLDYIADRLKFSYGCNIHEKDTLLRILVKNIVME
jgi:hypothetical protein